MPSDTLEAKSVPSSASPAHTEPSPNHPLIPEHTSDSNYRLVPLRLQAGGARRVTVAGTFNRWMPDQCELTAEADGWWAVNLALAPGRYEYRFVVDGAWTNGPSADGYVSNSYGTSNCVLLVS